MCLLSHRRFQLVSPARRVRLPQSADGAAREGLDRRQRRDRLSDCRRACPGGSRSIAVMGRSWWLPRRYRGRDIAAWLRLVGWFDRKTDDLPRGVRAGEPNPQLTGADGGHDISAHTLSRDGVRLLGRLLDVQDGCANFADDLATNVRTGDQQAGRFLDRIDALADDDSLDVPPPGPTGRPRPCTGTLPVAVSLRRGKHETGAAERGIDVVVWATGYRHDFGWVGLPFLAPDGFPIQTRGVTAVPVCTCSASIGSTTPSRASSQVWATTRHTSRR